MTHEGEESPDARRSGQSMPDASWRKPAKRDRDRVLYSEGFRRLGGVTQVATGSPNMGLHNRLTHSLKVEQVGTSLVSRLLHVDAESSRGINKWAIATACLAHDIGHPPFGHAGEMELNELVVCEDHLEDIRSYESRQDDPCRKCVLEDGFEGNAQSFRILTALAVHRFASDRPYGLDLTRASLSATSKYPWTRGAPRRKPKKWGAYDCDADTLRWVAGSLDQDPSLDAQIMDWADDISYAVHDIEDFYRVGIVPIDDYKGGTEALRVFLEYCEGALGAINDEEREAVASMLDLSPTERFGGKASDLAALDTLRGTLLTKFIDAASIEGQSLRREAIPERLNAIMKQFIWYHVIDDPTLAYIQVGQRRVLREIFEIIRPVLHDTYKTGRTGAPTESELRRLPHDLRRTIEIGQRQQAEGISRYTSSQVLDRALLDFMAMLSDAGAYELHARLKGREAFGHL